MNIDKRQYDARNCSPIKNFTQIPKEILRNPELSFKAKGIFCLLLSNSEGWISYIEAIQKQGTEGIAAITTGIRELEKAHYLWRVSYVDKCTKIKKGSFWAYTDIPGEFQIDSHLQWLENNNLEIWGGSKKLNFNKEKPNIENQDIDNQDIDNQRLSIYKSKNTKSKDINNNNKYISGENEKSTISRRVNTDTKILPNKESKKQIKEKDIRYIPLADQLAAVLKEKQNITTPPSHIIKWAKDIRLACEERKINPGKLKRDLKIYADNFNADFRPIIESGKSLREKLPKLWSFIERCQNPKQSKQDRPSFVKNFPAEDFSKLKNWKTEEVSHED